MALKKAPRRKKADVGDDLIDDQPPVESRIVLFVALIVLLTSMTFVFLKPWSNGDTFMTLAGGRDVFDGKLGQPDDWSFNSEGRVWINQSWGTGVLYYALWKQVGSVGIVVVKGVLICLMSLFIVLAARQFGTTYSVAILVTAFVLDAMVCFIDMRANVVGMAMLATLLWMLFWSYGRPHRIWLAVPLLTIWAHMHGSFIFGIAMLGLWTVTNFGVLLWQGRRLSQLKHLWTLPVATLLALILSAVTSPFGITNVIQPFSLMGLFQKEESWPMPSLEMTPTFSDVPAAKTFYATPWYLFMLGCLAAPLILRVIGQTPDVRHRSLSTNTGQLIKWLFIFVLGLITIVMAVKARRFMSVSLIVCAPLLAFELQRLFSHRRYSWPTGFAIVGSVLLGGLLGLVMPFFTIPPPTNSVVPHVDPRLIWGIAALVLALSPILGTLMFALARGAWSTFLASRPRFTAWISWLTDRRRLAWSPMLIATGMLIALSIQMKGLVQSHDPRHPLYPNHNIFGRMVGLPFFPIDAVDFLSENEIKGNMLNDWPWEGFLHWTYPELKVMLGGRSRQVYSPRAAQAFMTASDSEDYSLHTKLGIALIATSAAKPKMSLKLFADKKTPWRIIYYDGKSIIAANQDLPESRQYILDADAGKLIYPSTKSEKLSLAARRLSFSSTSSSQEIWESVEAATKEYPMPQLYRLLYARSKNDDGVSPQAVIAFFESELVRLHDHDDHQSRDFSESRLRMAQGLAAVYAGTIPPQTRRAEFWQKYSDQVKLAFESLARGLPYTFVSPIPEEFVQ